MSIRNKAAVAGLIFVATVSAAPVRLGPGEFRWVPFTVKAVPTAVDCRYRVAAGGSAVHLEIMSLADFRRFSHRRDYDVLASTTDGTGGEIRRIVEDAGEYAAVLENDEHGAASMAELEVRTELNPSADELAQVLPPGRRLAVILISFGIFFVTVTWSAWRLLKVTSRDRGVNSPTVFFPRDR